MTQINFKRRSTFAIYCQRVDASDVAVDLTSGTITSQIRANGFSDDLTVAITDATNGLFTISRTPTNTASWPVATLYMDVQFDNGTDAVISDTVTVIVSDSQTQSTSSSTGLPGSSGNPLVFKDMAQVTGSVTAGANIQTTATIYAAHYLGSLTSDPTARPDGSAIAEGDFYWNSTAKELRTYNGANFQVNYTPSPSVAGDINYTGTLTGGTGIVNIGAGQIYKDAAGNIGIGTNSPGFAFDLRLAATNTLRVGSNSNDFGTEVAWNNSSGFGGLFTRGAYPLLLGSNETEHFRIDASGNVGIGVVPTSGATNLAMANGTAPTANIAGGILYVEAGALKYRGSSGTVTTLAAA